MRCHYEVLAIERDATPKDIKKAFHSKALKWHPDKHQKNNISPEEATERFQEIQNAYEVLSDPHERKWYDDHRDQILRGDDGNGDESENDLNLFKYFSASVYNGFGKDAKSFYNVYGEVFAAIDALDVASVVPTPCTVAPSFGDASSPLDDVNAFYQYWMSYVTQRTFGWVDEYKTTDAPTRQIRRAMDKENKKLRDAAKKAFTTQVRELVEFVRKRDPRMLAYQKQREQQKQRQLEEEEARKKAKQQAYEQERELFLQQEQERWNDHTSRFADEAIASEMEKLRQKMDVEILVCDLCNKSFKSTKQLKNHLESKKHRNRELGIDGGLTFQTIEDALDAELQAELAELKATKAAQEQQATQPDEEDDEEEETRVDLQKAEEEPAKEQIRLERERKAAEKRKERKEKRKEKKKQEVEKIVTKAKAKADEETDPKRKQKGRKE